MLLCVEWGIDSTGFSGIWCYNTREQGKTKPVRLLSVSDSYKCFAVHRKNIIFLLDRYNTDSVTPIHGIYIMCDM